jgi:Glycosyltransferase sugar-binding region containing DXD motif
MSAAISEAPGAAGIPLRAHLIWFGQQFPWVNVLAARSAALRGGFDEVVLHHDSDLSATPHYKDLVETPRVRLRRLNAPEALESCAPHTRGLQELFARLRTPATRSDLMRFALLYAEGGVYLDIDTVTLQSFAPLCCGVQAFCGRERIVYPATVRNSRSPLVKVAAYGRARLRDVLRWLPGGHVRFIEMQRLFPLAPNPAILASASRSPFIVQSIERMLQIDPKEQWKPNVIGPHLLQQMVADYRGQGLAVHPPEVFFPLGPVISEHWFRSRERANLHDVITEQTRLVHWYGSVETKHLVPLIDPEYVRKNAGTQLFSALALPFAG